MTISSWELAKFADEREEELGYSDDTVRLLREAVEKIDRLLEALRLLRTTTKPGEVLRMRDKMLDLERQLQTRELELQLVEIEIAHLKGESQ